MLEEERDRQSDSVGVEIDDGESVLPNRARNLKGKTQVPK